MSVLRWEGTATALSSISHGGETLGTITYLRREAFLGPQGRFDVPVVSGNAVRGALRDTAAHLFWEAMGQPRLPLPVVHALWSGGALVKTKTQPLTGQRLADLRAMVAHIGVFGAAGGGRIIDGALSVGKLVPLCTQTRHLLPPELVDGDPLPDLHDLLQIERYSRVPDAPRLNRVLSGSGPEPDDEAPDVAEDDLRMRYGVETFVPGTRFHAWFALRHPTGPEHAFFVDVLDRWLPEAAVGGRVGRGHGRVHFNLSSVAPPPVGDWRTFGGYDIENVRQALTWLD